MGTRLEGQIASVLLNTFGNQHDGIDSESLLIRFQQIGVALDNQTLLTILEEFEQQQAVTLRRSTTQQDRVFVTALYPSLQAFL